MPFPVSEKIAQDLEAALKKISVAAGYSNDVIVERAKIRGPNPVRDRLLILHQGDPGPQKESPNDRVTWDAAFVVACYVVESETSDVPIDQRINSIDADVQKAVMVDRQRSGLAHDTWIAECERFADAVANAYEGVYVAIRVQYRVRDTDPYTQG